MDYVKKSFELRKDILKMIYKSKAGHIGGDFSVLDILVSLYYKQMNISPESVKDPDGDRFVLSKGHSVESLYVVLADIGFFPKSDLDTYFQFGSKYIGHPNNKINGIEMNSGSLGHGLSVCVGMALAGKMDKKNYRIYTVLGDGELAEGSVWEGFMSAGHYKLNNLCAIIDKNGLQISGTTDQVMSHEILKKRIEAFNWNVIEARGHDFKELFEAYESAEKCKDKPTAIIAKTIKGYGLSFIENNVSWHHKIPTESEYEMAINAINQRGGLS